MNKQYQECEVEFRCEGDGDYPHVRGLVVYAYGGTIEEVIKQARKQLRLRNEWTVVSAKDESC